MTGLNEMANGSDGSLLQDLLQGCSRFISMENGIIGYGFKDLLNMWLQCLVTKVCFQGGM